MTNMERGHRLVIKTDYRKGGRQLGEEINDGSHIYYIFVKS